MRLCGLSAVPKEREDLEVAGCDSLEKQASVGRVASVLRWPGTFVLLISCTCCATSRLCPRASPTQVEDRDTGVFWKIFFVKHRGGISPTFPFPGLRPRD